MKEVYVLGLHWGSHSVAPFYVIHFLNRLASVIETTALVSICIKKILPKLLVWYIIRKTTSAS